MMIFILGVTFGLFGAISAGEENVIPPLISFDKGRIGVNFLGFKASAGLGGIITGNPADGGLYAEAGTPFGQFAHAGLGGQVDGQGRSTGGLFAGATAGNGIGAKAGLGGAAGNGGSYGTSYAGASAGGLTKTSVKNIGYPPIGNVEVNKDTPEFPQNIQVVSTKQKIKNLDKVVESKDAVPPLPVDFDVRMSEVLPPYQPPIYIEKTKFKVRRRPHLKRKQIFITQGGYNGLDSLPGPPIAPLPDFIPAPIPGDAYGRNDVLGTKTVTVRKTVNPQLINDIFNIPISALTAVSQLVGGITKNIEGSVTVNKSVTIDTEKHKS